jgi:mono/diheme cytochrome c family protein
MRVRDKGRRTASKIGIAHGVCLTLALLPLAGCRATPPSKAEAKVATWTKHHLTIRGKSDVNPLKPTAEVIADGKDSFTSYCMVCHGLDGQNTGVPFAESLSPPVPSLASAQVQSYTDGQLKWIIEYSDREMWEMVEYIRHLPPAGSLGAPRVYSGSSK